MKLLIRKALLDFTSQGKQAVISFISVVVGMTFFGLMLFSDIINNREIKSVYQAANPSSFTVSVDGRAEFDELERIVSEDGEIGEYEIRPAVSMEGQAANGDYKSLFLFGIDAQAENNINQLKLVEKSAELGEGNVYIENGAISVAGFASGDTIRVRDYSGLESELKIDGSINDMFVHPAYIHNCIYLYISNEDIASYGATTYQILAKCAEDPYDIEQIRKVSHNLNDRLNENGIEVTELNLPDKPGESMHADEYKSTLFLLRVFSIAALIFGCITIANLLSSIFATKMKQIGILKSLGTTTSQIFVSYSIAFSLVILLASTVSTVFSVIFSKYLCAFLLSLGNIISDNLVVSNGYIAIYIVSIIIAPMLLLFIPMNRGTRISIKDSMNDYGIVNKDSGSRQISDYVFITGLSRPTRISLRNVFAKRRQFIMNLTFLAIGGLLFVLVLTTQNAINSSLNSYLDSLHYDYEFSAGKDTLNIWEKKWQDIDQIKNYEAWKTAQCVQIDSETGVNSIYQIVAPANNSEFFDLTIREGEGLSGQDISSIVISDEIAKSTQKTVGDMIELYLNGNKTTFRIGGIAKVFESKIVYFTETQMNEYFDLEKINYSVKCQFKKLEFDSRAQIRNLENQMEAEGVRTIDGQGKIEMGNTLSNHYSVTLNTLLVVVVLLVIVVSFGISASLGIQMKERAKEIGILKSIGATEGKIMSILSLESIVFALIATVTVWVFSIPLAYFFCQLFCHYILGEAFVPSLANIAVADLIWFVFSVTVVFFACRRPAKFSAKQKIREVFS